ncbi:MAG: hypothetical protein ACKO5K_11185 [Armatimonadota bacterium]
MRILIVAAALPPAIDGIGDYAATLARALAGRATVAVAADRERPCASIEGVEILPAFDLRSPRGVETLPGVVAGWRPDWTILQYNPFSWGRRGFNPYLPMAMERIRRAGTTRIGLMVHERYVPLTTAKYLAMSLWQRPQYRLLVRGSDVLFCSTEPWMPELRALAPGRSIHLAPAGSGIPRVEIPRSEARQRLGIPEGTFVAGFFGFAHASKPLGHVASACQAIAATGRDVRLLYIGLQPDIVRAAVPGMEVIADGSLPAMEVSRRFAAMDLLLCPFVDGVSTRRTTLMTGLQHGIPTLGTVGEYTSPALAAEDDRSMRLVPCTDVHAFASAAVQLAESEVDRERIGAAGLRLFEADFAPDVLAQRVVDALRNANSRTPHPLGGGADQNTGG